MLLLAEIFLLVTLPIVALIAIGYVVQSRVPETRKVLAFIYANVMLPAFMIHFVSTTTLPIAQMQPIVTYTLLNAVLVFGCGWLAAQLSSFDPDTRRVVALGGSFGNIGNFGIPAVLLAFPPQYAVHQSIMAAASAIIFVPLCSLLLSPSAGGLSWRKAVVQAVTNPIVLGVIAGVVLKALDLRLPVAIAKPLEVLAAAYTGIALLGLGAALHGNRLRQAGPVLGMTLVLKLLVAPLLSLALAWSMGFTGTLLAVLVVAGSLPTATLVGVLAVHNPKLRDTASSIVFVSTVVAPVVVTLWIFAMRWLGG